MINAAKHKHFMFICLFFALDVYLIRLMARKTPFAIISQYFQIRIKRDCGLQSLIFLGD